MIQRLLDTVLLLTVLLIGWHGLHLLAGDALTSPTDTAARIATLSVSPRFWLHAQETGIAFAAALGLAVVIGLTVGLSLGVARTAALVAEPILLSLYSLPKVTLYPVILLIFGLGLPAKIAFGTIHGVAPIIIFAMNAVRHLPPIYLRAGRAMGLSSGALLWHVLVPAALPQIVSGLRIGTSLTLLGVLIGEMFASQRGLGYMIMNAIGLHDMATMLAVIVMLTTVAVLVNAVLLAIDHRLHRR
jgi:NitT/TauT family transport system permease protein